VRLSHRVIASSARSLAGSLRSSVRGLEDICDRRMADPVPAMSAATVAPRPSVVSVVIRFGMVSAV
jgi:hypothetical protein